MSKKDYFSVAEAAEIAGLSEQDVRALARLAVVEADSGASGGHRQAKPGVRGQGCDAAVGEAEPGAASAAHGDEITRK